MKGERKAMVRYDAKGRLTIREDDRFNKHLDEELLQLGSAVKFCDKHKGYRLQEVSDRLKWLKERSSGGRKVIHYTLAEESLLRHLWTQYGPHYRLYVKHFPGRSADAIKSKCRDLGLLVNS